MIKFRTRLNEKLKVHYAPAKRHLPKWQWYGLAILLISPLAYCFTHILLNNMSVTANGFITTDSIVIRAPEDCYIDTLSVRVGQTVDAGAMLVALKSPTLISQETYLTKELTVAKTDFAAMQNTELPALLLQQQASVKELTETQQYYEKLSKLRQQGIVTIMDLQNAAINYQHSLSLLNNIAYQIAKNKREFQLNRVSHLQKLDELQEQLAELKVSESLLKISAPRKSTVIRVSNQPKEYVSKGQQIMVIALGQEYYVRALIDPKYAMQVARGNKVKILLPDNKVILGTVTQQPNFTTEKNNTVLFDDNDSYQIVVKITLLEALPRQYQIYNLPVRIIF